jgi:plastocyanin
MGIRRRIVVATFLPAVAALSWPIVGSPRAMAETKQAATCTADGTALAIVADDNKFDKDCMAVPPEQAFTIELDNQDWGLPHNVSIYDTANGNETLYKGEVIYGPSKITYSVPAQAEGTYEFICDPHAEFMRGTFIVG